MQRPSLCFIASVACTFAIVALPHSLTAQYIPTPTARSLCDSPQYEGSAIYNRYCGGGGGRVYSGPSPAQIAEQQRQAAEAARLAHEAELKRQAAEADQQGMASANRQNWQDAIDHFIAALALTPADIAIQQHLQWANQKLAEVQANAVATQQIIAIQQRVQNAIASAKLQAMTQRMQNQVAVQHLDDLIDQFNLRAHPASPPPQQFPAPFHAPPAGGPVAKILDKLQPQVKTVDQEIQEAQTALRRLIASNAQNEQQREEWVASSEKATEDAKRLTVGLVIDLAGARLDYLEDANKIQRGEVVNQLVNRDPEYPGNSIHAAYGILINQKEQLEREKQLVRLDSKLNELHQQIEDFSMKNTEFTPEDLWGCISQIKKVEDLAGPSKDLLDASYIIYKQAASIQNLSTIQTNQEKSLRAANSLRSYIAKLQAQKHSTGPPVPEGIDVPW